MDLIEGVAATAVSLALCHKHTGTAVSYIPGDHIASHSHAVVCGLIRIIAVQFDCTSGEKAAKKSGRTEIGGMLHPRQSQ